jgi:hypothetical protein
MQWPTRHPTCRHPPTRMHPALTIHILEYKYRILMTCIHFIQQRFFFCFPSHIPCPCSCSSSCNPLLNAFSFCKKVFHPLPGPARAAGADEPARDFIGALSYCLMYYYGTFAAVGFTYKLVHKREKLLATWYVVRTLWWYVVCSIYRHCAGRSTAVQ